MGLKILTVVAHYVPAYHYGGVLHVAHSLAKALAVQGNEVRVCTTNLLSPEDNLDVPLDKPVPIEGVQVYYEPVCLSRYWGFSPLMMRRLWVETKWADVILIHFHYQFSSLIAGWIGRLLGKPYIIFSHGSLNRYGVTTRSRVRKHLYLKLLERTNFQNNLFTAYHSAEEMETSFKFGLSRVVPNGVAPETFEPLPPPGYFRQQYPNIGNSLVFLYLGRLDAGKGLDLLLPALQQLASKRSDIHLVLAGGNERGYEATVRQLILELGLSSMVTLTGLISGANKLGALQDADVFVLPSRSEGLSIAMLEAMFMGLPIITTDRVGLWRTIQENHCGLVTSLNKDQLAETLHLMAVSNDRTFMGQRGQKLIKSEYTWDVIARNLVTQIQELIPVCH